MPSPAEIGGSEARRIVARASKQPSVYLVCGMESGVASRSDWVLSAPIHITWFLTESSGMCSGQRQAYGSGISHEWAGLDSGQDQADRALCLVKQRGKSKIGGRALTTHHPIRIGGKRFVHPIHREQEIGSIKSSLGMARSIFSTDEREREQDKTRTCFDSSSSHPSGPRDWLTASG